MAETLPLSHSAGVTGSWRDTLFVWCGKISTEATKNDDDADDKTKDGDKTFTQLSFHFDDFSRPQSRSHIIY